MCLFSLKLIVVHTLQTSHPIMPPFQWENNFLFLLIVQHPLWALLKEVKWADKVNIKKQACCAGCRHRPSPDEAPPIGKIVETEIFQEYIITNVTLLFKEITLSGNTNLNI